MRRRLRPAGLIALAVLAGAVAAGPGSAEEGSTRSGSVYAEVTATEVVLGNALAERRWSRDGFRTTLLRDKRAGGRDWGGAADDFRLLLPVTDLPSSGMTVDDVTTDVLPRGGLRLSIGLSGTGVTVLREVEAYPDVAGFRSRTVVTATVPLVLRGATLDEVTAGAAVTPTLHSFRAGADWREPGYPGPDVTVGDPHEGTWRATTTAATGAALSGAGQWLSLAEGDRSVFVVAERADLPSSVGAYDGDVGRLEVDYSRDLLTLGPFEENAHAENPTPLPGRARVVAPGASLALDPVFTGLGSGDGDEPWQFARYLRDHRTPPYAKSVVFNSNGTDDNVISTGAKDDMDIATVRRVAPVARALGVDTFVLDDGWQAISGDWYPDSPDHPEPRFDGTSYLPRFPDSTFAAVREAIAPMKLGLWMSPMHFHNESETFAAHPEWSCAPVGTALVLYNTLQPEEGSNEAGIAEWSAAAIPHIESRIREAITAWQVSYFKFDFLAWLDCVGEGTLYDYIDAFVAMLDRLVADFPGVTFQVDETNDYRLFPFASVTRGPSWFQNGSPSVDRLLHNLWNLSPWVPAYSLGQHVLGGNSTKDWPVATLMAAALPSHITLFSDLRQLPAGVVAAAAPWTAFHARHRSAFVGVTYPLLADPLEMGWTALQTWDPDAGLGALLAFRQDAASATQRIALRNVPAGERWDLLAAPDDRLVRTVTSAELTSGIDVLLPAKRSAAVYVVRRHVGAAAPAPLQPIGEPLPATR